MPKPSKYYSIRKNYLIEKYIELNLLDKNLNKINNCWFNPSIYPTEGYIPICAQCQLDFDNFKIQTLLEDMEVEMKHPNSCLWNDYFIRKIKTICPSVKIVRKKEKNKT